MRKDFQKNMEKHSSGSLAVHQVRQLLKDWDIKVMSYVMIVIVMVALIAATVAWFLYFKVVAVSNMGMTTADCDTIKVEVKQGTEADGITANFVELKEGEENRIFVDMDMPLFDNVESYEETSETASEVTSSTVQTKTVSKMAPGVYGSLTIRLTSLNKEINRYRIVPGTLLTYIEGSGITVVEEDGEPSDVEIDSQDRILRDLAKGHILFFENRMKIPENNGGNITIGTESKPITDYTHNKKYVFCNPIDSESFMEGDLGWDETKNKGTPTEVTIYWYWPYEYENLSKEIKNTIKLPESRADLNGIVQDETRLKYFDKDKMQEIVNDSIPWDETQLYDYADTRLGTYVKSVKVRLKVDGYHVTS